MRQKSIESALLMAVGLIAAGEGLRIILRHTEKLRALEAGCYLAVTGVLLLAVTTVYWRSTPDTEWKAGPGIRWVITAMLILVAYAVLLPTLGYLLSTLLIFIVYLRTFGAYSWLFVLGFSGAMAIGSTWLWERLAIMMPSGPMPWP